MALFDLPLDQLRGHVTRTAPPDGLADFWSRTLIEAARDAWQPRIEPVTTVLTVLDSFDVTFSGFGGDEIRAWLHLPAGSTGRLPCVVEYVGYGGGRGLPHQNTFWACAGYAHLVMDSRGQGSGWSTGHTADPNQGDAAYPGLITRGILDPAEYYYRRLYVDAVRAVEVVREHPRVDPRRIAVAGGSQGGGLALAVAALRDDVAACVPEVPFLADIRRATEITDAAPYSEIVGYLKMHRDRVEAAFHTLSHIDVAVLSRWATAPALFSVGLMDPICPPSTVYAAFNAYAGPKQIVEYPYNQHEGGGEFHAVAKADWLRRTLATGDTAGRADGTVG